MAVDKSVADNLCICPVVDIRDAGTFVTSEMMLKVARELRATVHLTNARGSQTCFGKHVTTCPCWTVEAERGRRRK